MVPFADPGRSTPAALTIAGSDSGGGAGIQADLKTFAALGVFGCSAITAITAQNTQGVDGIWAVQPAAVAAQIRSVLNDLPVQVVKTGMLYQPEVVTAILEELSHFETIPVVVDPVLVATSGDALSQDALAAEPVFWQLLQRAQLVTPNLQEAARLLQTQTAINEQEMQQQGRALIDAGLQGVFIKGGHLSDINLDVLLWRDGKEAQQKTFRTEKIHSNNTHGTGCTLASAIAAGLAKGLDLVEAVGQAKIYITGAIEHGKHLQLGHGHGPVQHFFSPQQ